MTIGERLKLLRKSKKKSREQVAHDLGITVRALQTYEIGERGTPTDILIMLARYYEVSTDYILGLSEAPAHEISENELKFSNSVVSKLTSSFDLLSESTKVDIVNWLKKAIETIEEEENKEEEPELYLAASDGNPVKEVDRGVIKRLEDAPSIDPAEFDEL